MKKYDKKAILDFIENQNPVYWFCGDVFYTNFHIMKKVIDEAWFDYYIELLKTSEDGDECIVADYYDENLNSVICFDVDVYCEFSSAGDMLSYLLSLQNKQEAIKEKINTLHN